MEDNEIIELYWKRDEVAILETDKKYGKYCSKIAYNILASVEDSEECVNDTYLHAWNALPSRKPRARYKALPGAGNRRYYTSPRQNCRNENR